MKKHRLWLYAGAATLILILAIPLYLANMEPTDGNSPQNFENWGFAPVLKESSGLLNFIAAFAAQYKEIENGQLCPGALWIPEWANGEIKRLAKIRVYVDRTAGDMLFVRHFSFTNAFKMKDASLAVFLSHSDITGNLNDRLRQLDKEDAYTALDWIFSNQMKYIEDDKDIVTAFKLSPQAFMIKWKASNSFFTRSSMVHYDPETGDSNVKPSPAYDHFKDFIPLMFKIVESFNNISSQSKPVNRHIVDEYKID